MPRSTVLMATMLVTLVAMRAWLHAFPDTDLFVGPYDVHHLFTGLVLIVAGGIPAVLLPVWHRWSLVSVGLFGVGLSLALDEWLYLIVTDGTNASYVTPLSFWGGVAAVLAACGYTWLVSRAAVDRTALPRTSLHRT